MALKSIDYTALKAAMKAKNYAVSEGDLWTAADGKLLRDFCYLQGVDQVAEFYGLPYTSLLPADFPGVTPAEPEDEGEGDAETEVQENIEVQTDGAGSEVTTQPTETIASGADTGEGETLTTPPIENAGDAPAPEQTGAPDEEQPNQGE